MLISMDVTYNLLKPQLDKESNSKADHQQHYPTNPFSNLYESTTHFWSYVTSNSQNILKHMGYIYPDMSELKDVPVCVWSSSN